jgi:hypothetical protein
MPLVNNKLNSRFGNGAGKGDVFTGAAICVSSFVRVRLKPRVTMSRIGNPQAKFHVNP